MAITFIRLRSRSCAAVHANEAGEAPIVPQFWSRSPFVGRERELARLHACLAAARQGEGGVALVAGEPGIGKTRLLAEFAQQARAAGVLVLLGHSYDGEGMPPYLPFAEALRGYLRGSEPDQLRAQLGSGGAQIALLLPELLDQLPDLAAKRAESPELDRYRLFEAVTDLLLAAARAAGGGLLLVLEDLHWADAASLALLQHVGRRLSEAPVLLAATYRSLDIPRTHPLHAALADVTRQRTVERLQLRPLLPREVTLLIAALIGTPAAPRLAERVYDETEGNPFFITELVRQLAADGVDFSATVAAGAGWSVPEGVRQVIGTRLARLSEPANAVLQAAAVLGTGIRYEVLTAMSTGQPDELLEPLDEVLAAGLLTEQASGYDFAHALIRQTIADAISLPRRQRLHLRAAEAIEQVNAGNLTAHLAALAEHYRLAGALADPEKAISYAMQAGEAAAGAFAYHGALAHWQAALDLLAEDLTERTTARRAKVLAQLGSSLFASGADLLKGIEHFEQALALYEALGDAERVAEIHSQLGRAYSTFQQTMDVPKALAHFRAAQTLMERLPENAVVGYMHIGLAQACFFAMRFGEALAAAERAVALGERLRDARLAAHAAARYGELLPWCGQPAEGLELLEHAWHEANRLNDPMLPFSTTRSLNNALDWLGDCAAALRACRRAQALPQVQYAPNQRFYLATLIAEHQIETGDLDTARQSLAELYPAGGSRG